MNTGIKSIMLNANIHIISNLIKDNKDSVNKHFGTGGYVLIKRLLDEFNNQYAFVDMIHTHDNAQLVREFNEQY